jgi:hypothetical protein
MAKQVRLSGTSAAVVNNALNYLLNAIPYATTGMGVSPSEAERVRKYFHDFPDGTHPVDPDMARVGAEALRRVLDLLNGDPELSILIAEEPVVAALADRLERSAGGN